MQKVKINTMHTKIDVYYSKDSKEKQSIQPKLRLTVRQIIIIIITIAMMIKQHLGHVLSSMTPGSVKTTTHLISPIFHSSINLSKSHKTIIQPPRVAYTSTISASPPRPQISKFSLLRTRCGRLCLKSRSIS